jgi:hypothetical protein
MHKYYSVHSGVQFRMGVKDKILLFLVGIIIFTLFLNLETVLEIIIAGF